MTVGIARRGVDWGPLLSSKDTPVRHVTCLACDTSQYTNGNRHLLPKPIPYNTFDHIPLALPRLQDCTCHSQPWLVVLLGNQRFAPGRRCASPFFPSAYCTTRVHLTKKTHVKRFQTSLVPDNALTTRGTCKIRVLPDHLNAHIPKRSLGS